MRLRRLGWSGVEIEYEGSTLLIDYILDTSPLVPLRGPDEPFPASSQPGLAIGALLTHLHADHADPSALKIALQHGSLVLRPEPATGNEADVLLTAHAEAQFAITDLATEVVGPWQQRVIGPFKVYSVPAVDGFGDPQVSWIVECGRYRIIHAGDTLFHGYWWRIAHRFGRFDAAFLPVNSPVVNFPHLEPASPIEAVMSPEEAAVAANILRADLVIPIHYGSIHKPPMYTETDDVIGRLETSLGRLKIPFNILIPGIWVDF